MRLDGVVCVTQESKELNPVILDELLRKLDKKRRTWLWGRSWAQEDAKGCQQRDDERVGVAREKEFEGRLDGGLGGCLDEEGAVI